MSDLYQLHWVYPIIFPTTLTLHLTQTHTKEKYLNIIDRIKQGVPGAIMYPALLTPQVIVGEQSIEFLLLVKERFADRAKLAERVNWQLKVMKGLDPLREYNPQPLFPKGKLDTLIKVHGDWDIATDLVATGASGKGRFRGRLDSRAVDIYQKNGFKHLYSVEVDFKALASATFADEAIADMEKRATPKGEVIDIPAAKSNADNPDWILWKTIANVKLQGSGNYCFVGGGDDARIGPADFKNPILNFHPLIHYKKLEYANLAHMGDIHVTSRQQFLAASEAKVIHAAGKPTVGSLVNTCSQRVKSLFGRFGGDSDVHVIVVGGDFVDYIRSMYTTDLHDASGKRRKFSVRAIWDTTAVTDSIPNYTDFPDFITVYSFALDCYRKHAKPVYAVTGNHDAYSFPFGVSPRVLRDGEASKKGNEGIPADHNMTIYECILSQGPTYGKVVKDPAVKDPLNCMLLPRRFLWFYAAYTPWADFAVWLPKQIIVAMAWGDGENMISPSNWEQGVGHLPRSVKGVSNEQLAMLKGVLGDNGPSAPGGKRNVILTTHFTFASFAEKFPENDARSSKWGDKSEGHIFYKVGKTPGSSTYSEFDMGTFEVNREDVYKKIILDGRASGSAPIQLILTGHSHRRALYTFRGTHVPTAGSDSVITDYTDFPANFDTDPRVKDAKGDVRREPWIVLSDSGGPVPRMNKFGEFRGWGSDQPAGTKILFSPSGAPKRIEPVRTGLKPRFAVSMDYFDVIMLRTGGNSFTDFKDDVAIKSWESDAVPLTATGDLASKATFTIRFHDEFKKTYVPQGQPGAAPLPVYGGLYIHGISLFVTPGGSSAKHGDLEKDAKEIKLKRDGPSYLNALTSKWVIDNGPDLELLSKDFANATNRTTFASIRFAADAGSWWADVYDFSSAWDFEVEISVDYKKNVPLIGKKVAKIFEVDRHHAEIPDFDGRTSRFKYASLGA